MSFCIFQVIKIKIAYYFLTLLNFSLQFSTFFNLKQYHLFLVIAMHVEKLCSSPLREHDTHFRLKSWSKIDIIYRFKVYCDNNLSFKCDDKRNLLSAILNFRLS